MAEPSIKIVTRRIGPFDARRIIRKPWPEMCKIATIQVPTDDLERRRFAGIKKGTIRRPT